MIDKSSMIRKQRILLLFNFAMKYYRKVMTARYGEDMSAAAAVACRRQFEAFIPELPDFGSKMLFFNVIIESYALDLALYQGLQGRGISPEECAEIGMEAMEMRLEKIPPIIRKLIGRFWFSEMNIKSVQKQAAEQQLRRHPGNWVGEFVAGDGREFDWGIDYTECGASKFMKSMGGTELAPYLCNYDHILSKYFHWGMTRTTRIAIGCDRCNFRYKKPDNN